MDLLERINNLPYNSIKTPDGEITSFQVGPFKFDLLSPSPSVTNSTWETHLVSNGKAVFMGRFFETTEAIKIYMKIIGTDLPTFTPEEVEFVYKELCKNSQNLLNLVF